MWPFGRREKKQQLEPSTNVHESTRPPSHHYALAHIVLKELCMKNPYWFFGFVTATDKEQILGEIWSFVCRISDEGGKPSFGIEDVRFEACRIQDFPMVLIYFPPPQGIAEVFIVAIILKISVERLSECPENPEVRYFTLEKGVTEDHRHRTVLCEWDMDGTHLNYGDGPETYPRGFIEAIERYL